MNLHQIYKILNISLITVIVCLSTTIKDTYAQGFLKAQQTKIVDENGHNFLFRGMGLGGWMLQEGYMFKLSQFGRQYRIKEEITKLVGAQKANEFYDLWLQNHTTKRDINSLAAWGFNVVRLPMHYRLFTLAVDEEPIKGQNTWLEKGFTLTDSLLSWCKANHVYLILDLHATPGGQGNDLDISDRDPAKPSLWESKENQLKTIALWRKLADRYKNEAYIAGYDIINEPNWGFEDNSDFRGTAEKLNAPLRQLMVDITKAIREVDQKHIVIIEGNGFGNNYRGIFPKWDDNLVLSFHKYGNFNTTGSIQQFLDYREKEQIPIWLGESGENSNTWFTEAIKLMERNNIGWTWWQLKKMGINNPLEIKEDAAYVRLLDYWKGKAKKPSPAEAWKTLKAFALNTNISRNIYHSDVIDAMFRQVKQNTVIPFKRNQINKGTIVKAVDYDLGAQRAAYYDTDSARYQYTPGVNTVGNKGSMYRNDGVDIKKDKQGNHYIFDIKDGEWLKYTVNCTVTGYYKIKVKVLAHDAGKLSVGLDNHPNSKTTNLSNVDRKKWTWVNLGSFKLRKGKNTLQLNADKGGFDLMSLKFE